MALNTRPLIMMLLVSACATRKDLYDLDGDGYMGERDCEPEDPEVYPGSPREAESPNGKDDDCDGEVDEDFDADHDGVYVAPFGEDCDDSDAEVYPGQVEVEHNGKDDDCDGLGSAWPAVLSLDELQDRATGAPGLLIGRDNGVSVGSLIAGLGDLDGDGLSDLGLIDLSQDHLCLASSDGLADAVNAGELLDCLDPGPGSRFGAALSAGDFDHDGDTPDIALLLSPYGDDACVIIALDAKIDQDGDGVVDMAGCAPVGASGVVLDMPVSTDNAVIDFVGDLTADGAEELAVLGTPLTATSSPWSAGWIYAGGTSDPASTQLTIDEDPGIRRSVARAGDVNGDGVQDLLVGLPGLGEGGQVFLLLGGDDLLNSDDTIALERASVIFKAGPEHADWDLGAALVGGADLDDDGATDIAIGAPGAVNAWDAAAGAVLVYTELRPGERSPEQAIALTGGVSGQGAGCSLALPGDTDLDGSPDLLIGACRSAGDSRSDEDVSRAWLVHDPLTDLSPGDEVPLDSVGARFTSERGDSWVVAAAGEVGHLEEGGLQSGPEILLSGVSSDSVYLIWGQGY